MKKNKGNLEKEGDLLAVLGMRISQGRQGWRTFVAEEIAWTKTSVTSMMLGCKKQYNLLFFLHKMKPDSGFLLTSCQEVQCVIFWGLGTPAGSVYSIKIGGWDSGLGGIMVATGMFVVWVPGIHMKGAHCAYCSWMLLFDESRGFHGGLQISWEVGWDPTALYAVTFSAPIFCSTPHPCPIPHLVPQDQTSPAWFSGFREESSCFLRAWGRIECRV